MKPDAPVPFRDMKNGPCKRVVERELREFVNDLEERVYDYAHLCSKQGQPSISPGEFRFMYYKFVADTMAERGIEPKIDG
jgi:hypothetical protein